MNIIFLDYDGVVNTPQINGRPAEMFYPSDNKVNNPYAVKLIQSLCETYACDIVVISSWKYERNYAECLYNSGLSEHIKIIDFLPDELDKSEIINRFLDINSINKYIIIDDHSISNIDYNNFIKCDYNIGFDIEKYEQAQVILK